jgi:DNA-binding HxlR family transcriptional regulator
LRDQPGAGGGRQPLGHAPAPRRLYGTRRFDDFAQRVGISQPIAAARSRELVDEGLATRRPHQEPGHRTRSEYEPTDKGRDFATVLLALLQWGNRREAPTGASTQLSHTGCGDPAATELRCGRGPATRARATLTRDRAGAPGID